MRGLVVHERVGGLWRVGASWEGWWFMRGLVVRGGVGGS